MISAGFLACLSLVGCAQTEIVVGSKNFTESVILGELVKFLARDGGVPAEHRQALGGTRLVYNALVSGEIDAYVEYTGTLTHEIFAQEAPQGEADLRELLEADGLSMGAPLGFVNNYAIGMARARAQELGIVSLSDFARHPELVLRFGSEFVERADGWPGLRAHYGLPQLDVLGVDHDLAYRGLAAGDVDATDLYTTDAEIAYYDLVALEDDGAYFPRYQAVLLYRTELESSLPAAVASWARLSGAIDEQAMIAMNGRVKLDGVPENVCAADFLVQRFGLEPEVRRDGLVRRLWRRTLEHLTLVFVSLFAAVALALPLGVLAARRPKLGQLVLGLVGILQTIPALALLVFMIPLLGIGFGPAVVALFLYSLLPIVRNTHAGLTAIPAPLQESARALGLPWRARLLRIELPLALPSILAGLQTAAVINVGAATLGALIGAGGYGQAILTGIRLDDVGLILEGAIPAALLAVLVQAAFGLFGRLVVSPGLR